MYVSLINKKDMVIIMKKAFISKEQLEQIVKEYPTPFHIYDEKGIRENAKALKEAFSWNKGFKEYFAVKATPNPYLIDILREVGCGCDCSSMTELMLSEAMGLSGEDIMFSSNETPAEEYAYAYKLGAIINLDDITHIDFVENIVGQLPETMSCRYNPGGYMNAMDHLCSLIAPQTYVDKGDDLILYKYNNIMSSLEGFGKEESTTKFKQDIKSLNLNRIVIITSDMTYSASEATIIGLEPYMEVTTIGTRTGGKNQSSIQFRPSDFTYTSNNKPVYSKRINDWLLIPIIATFYNSKNETFNTLEGLTPDYEIDEDDFLLRELGSEKEPLIAAGIEYLTTGNVTTGSNLKNAKSREFSRLFLC